MRRMAIADRFDHVSIATRKMASMVPLVRDVLGARFLMGAEETARHFRWAQFQLPGGGIIELMEPTDDEGFVARFLKRRGEGVHHLTFRVRNLRRRLEELETAGWQPVDVSLDDPTWREAFIHPKDAHGVLIQLAESELSYPEEVSFYQQLDLALLEP